ncbi:MAG: DUF3944 domain-containing protein [Deltaproteobacteria bacterium]|nr:DUF3944 domain-containing protein [Deltaproteobacteria bacterium]
MKYRQDPDLEFLKECTSEDLNILVEVLLHNKDGQPRSIVQLPNHTLYKQFAPNHASYWEVIAGEIQRYGSNPLAALARAGRGKHYFKILGDVCGRFSVSYNPDASVEVIERTLYVALFSRAIPRIPTAELQVTADAFGIKPPALNAQAIVQALHEAMQLDDMTSYLLSLVVAHGSAMSASNVGYKSIAPEKMHAVLDIFQKPLGIEFESVSPLSFTGSAHWIVIPVVVQLACLRAKKNAEKA